MNTRSGRAARSGRVPKILIADDDPQVLTLFTEMLHRQGYSVIGVSSGGAANEAIESLDVDLLVLDLNMPEPDGFDLLKSLRVKKPTLPILVISGYLEGPLLKASEILGAAASLSKLEAPRKLAETVRELLKQA